MNAEHASPIPPKRFHFDWIPDVFFHPRQIFTLITSQAHPTWTTPLLALTITALLLVFVNGSLERKAALSGEVQLPRDYQWYTPEQQAQFMQTMEARQGPVFLYVIPGIAAVTGVWLGWLIVSGLLNLLLTMLGGRGESAMTLNIIAWSSLPLALRDLVRSLYMLATQQPIASQGLSGFADPLQGNSSLFLFSLLTLVDIYLLWQIALTTYGTKSATHLPTSKAFAASAISIFAVILLQALLTFGVSSLSSLTIIRPFF